MNELKVYYKPTESSRALVGQLYRLNNDNTVTLLGSETNIHKVEPVTHWSSDNQKMTVVVTSREQYRSIIDGLELQTDNKPHDWKNWRDWLKF